MMQKSLVEMNAIPTISATQHTRYDDENSDYKMENDYDVSCQQHTNGVEFVVPLIVPLRDHGAEKKAADQGRTDILALALASRGAVADARAATGGGEREMDSFLPPAYSGGRDAAVATAAAQLQLHSGAQHNSGHKNQRQRSERSLSMDHSIGTTQISCDEDSMTCGGYFYSFTPAITASAGGRTRHPRSNSIGGSSAASMRTSDWQGYVYSPREGAGAGACVGADSGTNASAGANVDPHAGADAGAGAESFSMGGGRRRPRSNSIGTAASSFTAFSIDSSHPFIGRRRPAESRHTNGDHHDGATSTGGMRAISRSNSVGSLGSLGAASIFAAFSSAENSLVFAAADADTDSEHQFSGGSPAAAAGDAIRRTNSAANLRDYTDTIMSLKLQLAELHSDLDEARQSRAEAEDASAALLRCMDALTAERDCSLSEARRLAGIAEAVMKGAEELRAERDRLEGTCRELRGRCERLEREAAASAAAASAPSPAVEAVTKVSSGAGAGGADSAIVPLTRRKSLGDVPSNLAPVDREVGKGVPARSFDKNDEKRTTSAPSSTPVSRELGNRRRGSFLRNMGKGLKIGRGGREGNQGRKGATKLSSDCSYSRDEAHPPAVHKDGSGRTEGSGGNQRRRGLFFFDDSNKSNGSSSSHGPGKNSAVTGGRANSAAQDMDGAVGEVVELGAIIECCRRDNAVSETMAGGKRSGANSCGGGESARDELLEGFGCCDDEGIEVQSSELLEGFGRRSSISTCGSVGACTSDLPLCSKEDRDNEKENDKGKGEMETSSGGFHDSYMGWDDRTNDNKERRKEEDDAAAQRAVAAPGDISQELRGTLRRWSSVSVIPPTQEFSARRNNNDATVGGIGGGNLIRGLIRNSRVVGKRTSLDLVTPMFDAGREVGGGSNRGGGGGGGGGNPFERLLRPMSAKNRNEDPANVEELLWDGSVHQVDFTAAIFDESGYRCDHHGGGSNHSYNSGEEAEECENYISHTALGHRSSIQFL